MDSLLSVAHEYRILVGAVVLTMLLIFGMKIWWDKVSLFLLNFYYRIPVIGKLARLSSDYTSRNKLKNSDSVWLASEETLCMDYLIHYQLADKDGDHFDKCANYLRKVDETGRSNLHFLGWILIAGMVFIEAMGFSYVLSGFTIPGASEDLQKVGALGIALLVSVLLVAFTHYSGHELHYNNLIKKVRSMWSKNAAQDENLEHDNKVDFDRDVDEDQPQWRQMLNRLPHNANVTPKYTITIGAVALIVMVAVGATYVRGKSLEQESAGAHLGGASSTSAYEDPYANNLPQDLVDEASIADRNAEEAVEDAYKSAGWGTFIVLAVIFVFIQLLGIIIGFKTGFSGKQSSEARKDMGKFKTKREFDGFYYRKKQSISRAAQKNLTELQQRLSRKVSDNATDKEVVAMMSDVSDRNFLAYAEIEQDKEGLTNKRDLARLTELRESAVVTGRKIESGPIESANEDRQETPEQMEARIRKEIQARMKIQPVIKETEEDMIARIEAEERINVEEERKQETAV